MPELALRSSCAADGAVCRGFLVVSYTLVPFPKPVSQETGQRTMTTPAAYAAKLASVPPRRLDPLTCAASPQHSEVPPTMHSL